MTVDMSPEAVSARLRKAAELTDLTLGKRLHAKVDYSPEAISARLRQVEELRRLCLALGERTSG